MNSVGEKHLFSFYIPELSSMLQSMNTNELIVQDQELLRRIRDVLRMQIGMDCYLFDKQQHALARLTLLNKKELRFVLQSHAENNVLKPHITLLLPLLKRAALEDAVYNATEAGVSLVHLIKTTKSAQYISDHESERLQKIIITACEQSKQFVVPELVQPVPLENAINATTIQAKKMWFDKEGTPLFNALSEMRAEQPERMTILIGPEGDFTAQERANITNAGFESYRLTPTTLRSVSAVTLAIGMIRTFVDHT